MTKRDCSMKVGRSVTLRVNDHFFQSRMIDIKDKYIYLDMPINLETRKTSFLQTNTPIEVEYIGDDRARYHFSSKVVDRQLTNIPKLIIATPKQVERIQRREFEIGRASCRERERRSLRETRVERIR